MYGFSAEPQAVTTRSGGKLKQKKARYRPQGIDPVYDYSHITRPRRPVPLDDYLVERVEAKQTKNVESQTSAFIDVPYDQDRKSVKIGQDSATQTDVEMVFNFNTEVRPLVELIVAKTLEQSLQEVHEEEEFVALGEAHTSLTETKEKEDKHMRETEERAKELQLHLLELRERESKRVEAETEDLTERTLDAMLQGLLEYVEETSMDILDKEGYFPDTHRVAAEFEFLPWLIKQVDVKLQDVLVARRLVTDIMRNVIENEAFTLPLPVAPVLVVEELVEEEEESEEEVEGAIGGIGDETSGDGVNEDGEGEEGEKVGESEANETEEQADDVEESVDGGDDASE